MTQDQSSGEERRPGPTIDLTATEVTGTDEANAAQDPSAPRSGARWRAILSGAFSTAFLILIGFVGAYLLLPLYQGTPEGEMLAPFEARIAKIEASLVAPREPDAALNTRITALEKSAQQPANNLVPLQKHLDQVTAQMQQMQDALSALQNAPREQTGDPTLSRADLEALSQRLAALEDAHKMLQAKIAEIAQQANNAAQQANDAAQRIADSAQRDRAGEDRSGRAAIAGAMLLQAIERGAPFGSELAAAEALAAPEDAARLAALQPFAATGVPGRAALSRELVVAIPALQQALSQAAMPETDGFLARLQASATRLVRIRPLGETKGDAPADVIARLKANAERGDVDAARAEAEKLPEALRAPLANWIAQADARAAALAAARAFAATALAAFSKPKT